MCYCSSPSVYLGDVSGGCHSDCDSVIVAVIVLMIMLFVFGLHKINIVSLICTSCNLQCFYSDASDWLMQ